jgi:drug/metabolite transporter (DMT)-like permease
MITPFLVQLLYGLLGPLNKSAIGHVPFDLYVGIKLAIAGLILIFYHTLIKGKSIRLAADQWFYYLQMILCGAIGAQYLKYWALQYVSASKAAFLFNSSPFFVAFFSWLRWRERLTLIQLVGLIISFLGLLPILMTTSSLEEMVGMVGVFSLPECAIIAAAALHAISFTAKRVVVHADGYASARVNGIYLLAGGIWSLASWSITGAPYAQGMLATALGYATFTTLIGKVLCSSLTLYLLRYYSATFLSFMGYWYPLCVAFWSWLLWGELLTYHYWLSAAIVLCGQLLFYASIQGQTKAIR